MDDNLKQRLADNPHYNPSKNQQLNIQTQEVKREEVVSPEPQKKRKRKKAKETDEGQSASLDSLPEVSADE